MKKNKPNKKESRFFYAQTAHRTPNANTHQLCLNVRTESLKSITQIAKIIENRRNAERIFDGTCSRVRILLFASHQPKPSILSMFRKRMLQIYEQKWVDVYNTVYHENVPKIKPNSFFVPFELIEMQKHKVEQIITSMRLHCFSLFIHSFIQRVCHCLMRDTKKLNEKRKTREKNNEWRPLKLWFQALNWRIGTSAPLDDFARKYSFSWRDWHM